MSDPVVTCDGHTYERSAIEAWFRSKNTSPITNEALESKALIPNIHLRSQIREFVHQNPQYRGREGGGAATRQEPVTRRVSALGESSPGGGGGRSMGTNPVAPRMVTFIKGRPIGLDLDDFLCVRSVHSNSQGYSNNIKRFEAICEVNGQAVSTVPDLRTAMGRIPNNAEMMITLVSPYVKPLTKGQPFGLSLTEGMVVQSIAAGSQAATRGVIVNSRLVAVDDVSVNFSELAAALGGKPAGQDIDFTFVPPLDFDLAPAAVPAATPVARPVAARGASAAPPPPVPRAAPPPPGPAMMTMRGLSAKAGVVLSHGEDKDVSLPHRQLGLAVSALEGDEGFLRITDVGPVARGCGVTLGALILQVAGKPLPRPVGVDAFARLVEDADRPLSIKIFRCVNFTALPRVPDNMCLKGYLQKKSASGSTFRPWGERLVELKAEGYLTYKSEKKAKSDSTAARRASSDASGVADEEDGGTSISLLNCNVVPLSKKRGGRDFAFEVVAAAKADDKAKVKSPGKAESGEVLTLAASTPQEGAQWIKSVQSAAVFFTEATVKRRREQMGEVADAMQLEKVFIETKLEAAKAEADDAAMQAEAIAASTRSADDAKKKREAEEDEELRKAMAASEASHGEFSTRREAEEEADRKSMLQALLLSSDMYAQQLHGTAEEQKSRAQWRLAYDSYKLAVSFYLKATAIADELDDHPDYVDAATMARINSDTQAAMKDADACFIKSQSGTKKKKHHHKDKGNGDGGAEGGGGMKEKKHKHKDKEPDTVKFGGKEGPDPTPAAKSAAANASPKSAMSPKSMGKSPAKSDPGEDWFKEKLGGVDELPPGWVQYDTDDGVPYYYNEETQETVWERPGNEDEHPEEQAMDLDALQAFASKSMAQGLQDGDSDSDDDDGSAMTTMNLNKMRAEMAHTLGSHFGHGKEGTKLPRRQTTGFNSFLAAAQKGNKGSDSDSSSDGDSSTGSESSFDESDSDSDDDAAAAKFEGAGSEADLGALTPKPLGGMSGGGGRNRSASMQMRASEGETKGRVLMELIESERRYLVILEQINQVAEWLSAEKKAIAPKDHGTLFQGATQLLDLSKGFLRDIDKELEGDGSKEEVFLEDVKIGALLNRYMPFFKIYTIYSDTYDAKQDKLKTLVGDGSTDFAKALRAAMEEKEVSGDFQSLLIQPIQRLPRYKMLLERMVHNIEKQTPKDTDLPLLKKAFETVSGVAMHINQSLRRQVDTLKLLELQSNFFPPVVLVSPGRRLIKKGELDKIADKNNAKQKYVFFLFNDALAYASKLFGGYYRFHRLLTVTGMDELSMTDHTTNRFRLTAEERQVTLQAKNYEDKQAWVKAINEKMNDRAAAAATFTSATAGQKASGFGWQKDDGSDDDEEKTGVGYERVKAKDKKAGGAMATNVF